MEQIYNRKISLLAFDLDGTLLNGSREISDITLEKIHAVMKKGVKVATASGRINLTQQVFVSQLGFKGPYVASNGAMIFNSEDGSMLYGKPIEDDTVKRLCAFSMDANMSLCLQSLDAFYFTQDNPGAVRFMQSNRLLAERGGPEIPVHILEKDYGNFDNGPTYKAIIHTAEETSYNELVQYLDSEPGLTYTFSDKNLFEINPIGTDKGIGIERVADFYGIPLSEVCAFGDYDNDIPIFEKVGLSIAMGNASDNLKAKAMYITDTNLNDGVAKALDAMAGCFF